MKKSIITASIILFFSLIITAEIPSPEVRIRHNIIETAKKYIGTKYRYGGTNANGFDCSGFVMFVYGKYQIKLPHSSKSQYRKAKIVTKKNARPADLVFFSTYRPGPSHVGIYLGDNKFIHSPSSGKTVKISKLTNSYYKKRFLGFGSLIDESVLEENNESDEENNEQK